MNKTTVQGQLNRIEDRFRLMYTRTLDFAGRDDIEKVPERVVSSQLDYLIRELEKLHEENEKALRFLWTTYLKGDD